MCRQTCTGKLKQRARLDGRGDVSLGEKKPPSITSGEKVPPWTSGKRKINKTSLTPLTEQSEFNL